MAEFVNRIDVADYVIIGLYFFFVVLVGLWVSHCFMVLRYQLLTKKYSAMVSSRHGGLQKRLYFCRHPYDPRPKCAYFDFPNPKLT